MEQLSSSYVVPGRILWLPARKELPVLPVRTIHGIKCVQDVGYGGPIVVISRPAEETDVVHFHAVTSFNGLSLEDRYGKGSRRCRYLEATHVPVFQSLPCPDNEKAKYQLPSLSVHGKDQMPSNSYINAREVYAIEWRLLQPFTGSSNHGRPIDQRLDYGSLNSLLRCSLRISGYIPGPQLIFNDQQIIRRPSRAKASAWKPPPVPIIAYPSMPELNYTDLKPILAVIIPGTEGCDMTSSIRGADSSITDDFGQPAGCMSQVTSRILYMFAQAGTSISYAFGSMCGRSYR